MKKKVAILGSVSHRVKAPYDDLEFEIWGINDLYTCPDVKRWDRWFQLHDPAFYGTADTRQGFEAMLQRYAKMDCPVYLFKEHPQIPNTLSFPYEELVEEFGSYFNNTISWMIAFAIREGFEEIHIYGVDMAHSSEYGSQRPSCEYFLGIAQGRGIKIYTPPESTLLKTAYLYGYQEVEENAYKKQLGIKKEYLIQRHDEAAKNEEEHAKIKNQYFGAIMAMEEIIKEV